MAIQFGRPCLHQTWAGFLIRVPIGLYFLNAARLKLMDHQGIIQAIQDYGVLPPQLGMLFGILLPYLELLGGGLLILGLWTTFASGLCGLLLISFILALGFYPYPENPILFNKDFLILGATLSLMASGPGALSVDNFRQSG